MTTTSQVLPIYTRNDIVFQINLGQTKDDGSPLNLTGGSARWAMAKSAAATPTITKSTTNGTLVLAQNVAGDWVVEGALSRTETDIAPGNYFMSCNAMGSDGKDKTVMTGLVRVAQTVRY